MPITKDAVLAWVRAYAALIESNREYLTELDSAIGDADHGVNMHRGFQAVLTKLPPVEQNDIGAILRAVGMALLSSVGGAGGPLYGTFFIEAGKALAGKQEFSLADWSAALNAAVKGVAMRGKASEGEKTMLDALLPASRALQAAVERNLPEAEALASAAIAAEAGMHATIPLIARKGRASYLGERSIGHQDPGATSAYLLLRSIAETWAG